MAYVIDLQLKGAQAIIAQINGITQAANQAKAAVGNGQMSVGGTGGSGGSSSNAANVNAQANYIKAQAQWLKAQVAAMNAMNRQNRQQVPQWLRSLRTLVYSTRIGFGQGGMSVMPLVGNLLKVLGQLPPEVEAAILAIGAFAAAIVMVTKMAVDYGTSFTKAYFTGGGSAADTARLAGVGGAAGISTEQLAKMAQAYNQALMNNPYAAARAAQGGYSPNYAGPYGDQNDTRRFLKGLQDVLNVKSDRDAIRMARGTPLEDLLWMRKASEGTRKFAMAIAEMNLSASQQRDSANVQIELNTAMAQANILLVQLGQMILPFVNYALLSIIEALQLQRYWYDVLQIGFYNLYKWIWDLIHLGPKPEAPQSAYDDLNRQKADAQARQTDALDRNTEANVNNTRALDNHRQVYGGGENARGALPDKYFNPSNASWTKAQVSLGQIPV